MYVPDTVKTAFAMHSVYHFTDMGYQAQLYAITACVR